MLRLRAGRARAAAARAAALAAALLTAGPAAAQPTFSDPERGARLFATAPAPGLLACLDCHSEDPLVNNFGNIFVGRNAAALIQRAVVSNTGGMGYFRAFYDDAALADIAAYLGNSPPLLDFGTVPLGRRSAPLSVTVNASSKQGLSGLVFSVEGPFEVLGHDCGSALAARRGCAVSLRFNPPAAGHHPGALLMAHSGLPAPARIRLTGQAIERPPAVARVQPSALTGLRSGQPRSVLLSNDSPQPLTLGATTVPPGFELAASSCAAGRVLPGGARCALAVVATGSAAAGVPAALRVLHDGEGGVSEVGLTAAAPRPSDGLRMVPAWADFGVQTQDTDAAPLELWLQHRGPQAVRLQSLGARHAAFQLVGGSCQPGLQLQPGDGCSVQLRHQPADAGPQQDELLVHVQGQDEAAVRVPLVARRLRPGQAWPRLQPAALPALAAGEQAQAWVLNAGAGPLQLQAMQLDGGGAIAFELLDGDGSCRAGQRLQAGQRCRLLLLARPGSAALAVATLRVQHDSSAPALRLVLQRAGTAPPVLPTALVAGNVAVPAGALAPQAQALRWTGQADPLVWADTAPGQPPQTRTLQLAHTGTAALRLSALGLDGPHQADTLLLAADGADTCRPGLDLAPGARCTIVLAWHAGGPGRRHGRLWARAVPVGAADAATTQAELAWQGQVTAPPAPWLTLVPEAVALTVVSGAGGPSADEQPLRLHNAGAAVLVLDALQLQAPGMQRMPAGEADCGATPVALLPGQACEVRVGWTAQAQAAAGGRWQVQTAGEEAADPGAGLHDLPLVLTESAAPRSNVGAGDLLAGGRWGLVLMLVLAAGVANVLWQRWGLWPARRRPGVQPHGAEDVTHTQGSGRHGPQSPP